MSDAETMAVYAKAAQDYDQLVGSKKSADEQGDLVAFVEYLGPNAFVLDLGCGPGHWSAKMKQAGLVVDAVDGSAEMAALAKTRYDVDARVETFDTLTLNAPYDGVWANFSLLHAPRTDFPKHLLHLHGALRPEGRLHLGMKLGQGESRDKLGRLFTYYEKDELVSLVQNAGFEVSQTRTGIGSGLSGVPDTYVVVTAHA